MKNAKYFPSYQAVCDSGLYTIRDVDTIGTYARRDNLKLDDRDIRFASNQEIISKTFISDYDKILNPGTFNQDTTDFALKVGIIGPKFAEQGKLSNKQFKKLTKETSVSYNAPKIYYESRVAAGDSALVRSSTISKWVKRDIELCKEFYMPVVWRLATHEENKRQTYLVQPEDKIPPNYDSSLEIKKKKKKEFGLQNTILLELENH